jgi:hypothetical protein
MVTNTGPTVINGDLGVSPGTAVTGFPPGTVIRGAIHSADPTAVTAQADAHTAYNDLVAEPCGTNLSGQGLGTSPGTVMVLAPGVYCFGSSAMLTGTLTLSGNGVYVFQIGSTLTTAANSSVVLANGATAQNGSSATLGTNTFLEGSIIALTSASLSGGGSSVAGHIFTLNGAVTLDTDAVDTASNQQFTIESDTTQPSGGFATTSDPNAIVQCTVNAPCPQELYLTFNTINQQPAVLGNPNALWDTNSINDPDELVSLTTTNLCSSNSVVLLGNEDETTYTFSGTISGDGSGNNNPCLSAPGSPTTGSYSLSTGEVGTYTIYALPDPSGTYTGTFNDKGNSSSTHKNAAGNGSDTLSLNVNADFSVMATLVVAPGELCPAQTATLTLSSSDPVAVNNGVDPPDGISSVSAGESVLLSLADNVGNLEWVIMTDQDANGNVLPVGSLYATGFSPAGVCSGTLIYDKPFAQKGVKAQPRPRKNHHPRHLTKQMREFEERIENRKRR